jgi:CRISPR/Cas system-associated exonuclease Cas4 (RecB family)
MATITVKSISYSTYSSYINCSEAFWLAKIVKAKAIGVSSNLVFGSSIHAACQAYYDYWRRFKQVLPKETLHRIFRAHYYRTPDKDILYSEKQGQKELFAMAEGLLSVLVEQPMPEEVIAVEADKIIDLGDFRLIGRADLVTRDKGVLTIWDIKTARARYGWEETNRAKSQLSTYALAHEEPVKLGVKLLLKQKTPSVEDIPIEYDKSCGESVVEEMRKCITGIEAGIHFKVKSFRCIQCGYRHICKP